MLSVSYFVWIWSSWSRSFTISPSCHIDLRLRRRFWPASFIPLLCSPLRMLARSAIYPFSRGMMMSALLRSTSSPPPGIQTCLFLPSPHSLFRTEEQERDACGHIRSGSGMATKVRRTRQERTDRLVDQVIKKALPLVELEHISRFFQFSFIGMGEM